MVSHPSTDDREPPWPVLRHSNMTITVSPRRVAMAVLAVIALSVTYLILSLIHI